MHQYIGLRELNHQLAKYIEQVCAGDEITITKRGTPLAKITAIKPVSKLTSVQKQAKQRTIARIKTSTGSFGQKLNRDELYD